MTLRQSFASRMKPERPTGIAVTLGVLLALTAAGLIAAAPALLKSWYGFDVPVTHPTQPVSEPGGEAIEVVFGFDGEVNADGVPAPWQSQVIRGSLDVSIVHGSRCPDTRAVRISSDRSHFILWHGASPYDPETFPILEWSWKVDALPPGGDVRTRREIPFVGETRNDKAAQVLVGFEGDEVLSYVWDTSAPVGTTIDEWSPVAAIQTQVVESGPENLGRWLDYRINVRDDYERLYGKPPGRVLGLSIQINSNHTASHADATICEIRAVIESF